MKTRILLLICVLLLAVSPVLAQDTEPGDAPPVVVELPAAFESLLNWLSEITYVPYLAVGATVIMSLIKFVLGLFKVEVSGTRAVLLALGLQVIGWVAFNLAKQSGVETEFVEWYNRITQALELLFPLALSYFGGHVLYEKSKGTGLLTGYRGYRMADKG